MEIQSFERSLYEISIEEMSIDRVNILLKSHFHGEISLLNSLDEFDANETFLGIQTFDEKISFLKTSELNQNFFRSYIILYEYFEGINTLSQSQQAFENWSDIIHYIDIPLLMYDQAGHPVIHNSSFVKLSLSIKECLEVKDNAQIHIDAKLFRVVREPLEKDLTVMLFFPVEEFLTSTMGKTKSEELGIITSSIAHELNNPLGGILAAIDVNLLDEEDQESEVSQRLEEMKLGVKRCKKLVETFLGFSRGKAQDISSQKNSFSVKDAVTQALDLIRFRLVENNISMNLDYSKKGDFKKEINPYILSMVFYLTYGALVTELSHYHLVSGSSSLKVDLNILESKDQIMMTVNEKLGNIESVFNSKLLAHLLELLELEFQHKNNVFFLKAI